MFLVLFHGFCHGVAIMPVAQRFASDFVRRVKNMPEMCGLSGKMITFADVSKTYRTKYEEIIH